MKTDFVNSGYFVNKTVLFPLRNPAIESFIEMDSETRLKSVKECRSLECHWIRLNGFAIVYGDLSTIYEIRCNFS